MPVEAKSIGTTTEKVFSRRKDYFLDVQIQNLSANNVYVTHNEKSTVTEGYKLVATTGTFSDDECDEDLYLIADGAASDVRIRYLWKPKPKAYQDAQI